MKKILKSLIALALVFALIVPTAMAAEPTPNYEIDVTKKLSEVTGDYAHFNGNTYTYELTDGDEGLLKFKDGNTIELAAGSDAGTEGKLQLVIDQNYLQTLQPGKHEYKLSESANPVDGETNTPLGEKTIEVTVYRNEADNKMEAVVLVKGNDEDQKSNLSSETKFATHKLVVTKKIEGNNADFTDKFDFDVTITGQVNDKYKVNDEELTYAADGAKIQVKEIGKDGTITITGLTPKDVTKVVEVASEKGYEVKYGEIEQAEDGNKTQVITNTKNAEIPTGVIETVAPFALVLVAAVAFGFVYFKKRSVEA